MPLDVLGRTRATLKESACLPWPKGPGNPLNLLRARDWGLQLFPMNEEFPVSASHKLALITSLPFVHTARRYYRLNDLVRSSDWYAVMFRHYRCRWEDDQTWLFRGSKSRNKVSVGEPAEGSLTYIIFCIFYTNNLYNIWEIYLCFQESFIYIDFKKCIWYIFLVYYIFNYY